MQMSESTASVCRNSGTEKFLDSVRPGWVFYEYVYEYDLQAYILKDIVLKYNWNQMKKNAIRIKVKAHPTLIPGL